MFPRQGCMYRCCFSPHKIRKYVRNLYKTFRGSSKGLQFFFDEDVCLCDKKGLKFKTEDIKLWVANTLRIIHAELCIGLNKPERAHKI